MTIPTKLIMLSTLLTALLAGWTWREHVLLERGRTEGAAPFIAEGQRQAAENKAIGEARKAQAAKAEFRFHEAMQAKEIADAQRQIAHDRRGRLVDELRDDLRTARSTPAGDPGPTGGPDGGRAGQCEQLLQESRELLAAGGELAHEGTGLVEEGDGHLAERRAVIELAREWAGAATLKAAP